MKRKTNILCIAIVVFLVLTPGTHAGGCRSISYSSSYSYPSYSYSPSYKSTTYYEADYIKFVTPVVPIYTVPPAYGALYYPPGVVAAAPGYSVPGVQGSVPAAAPTPAHDGCAEVRLKVAALELQIQQLTKAASLTPQLLQMQQQLELLKAKPGAAPPPQRQQEPMPSAAEAPKGEEGEDGETFVSWSTKGAGDCASCHDKSVAETKGGKFTLLDGGKVAQLNEKQAGQVLLRIMYPSGHKDSMPKNKKISNEERMKGSRLFLKGG